MNNNLKSLQTGLSFNNGVFEALISDASTWNVDSKSNDICEELRIFPPANMLESRKVTDNGPLFDPDDFGGSGRQFSLDKPIGIRQTASSVSGVVGSTTFNRNSETWPIRIRNWPKRDDNDQVAEYNFEFYEPKKASGGGTSSGESDDDSPAVSSVKYRNPTRGETDICKVDGGGNSECVLKRVNKQNRGANGSTMGGTA